MGSRLEMRWEEVEQGLGRAVVPFEGTRYIEDSSRVLVMVNPCLSWAGRSRQSRTGTLSGRSFLG